MTHFLRFPDEATGMAALDAAGLLNDDGEFITASHNHALDVIGTITTGGEYDKNGDIIVPFTELDGWHVNYSGDIPANWEQYSVNPQSPYRVFS